MAVGSAETIGPLPEDKPVVGLHIYELPPLALIETDLPLQITGAVGLAVITGRGFTVTVTVFVPVHPPEMVPVTV